MGYILFTNIRKVITQSESRKVILRFKILDDMFQMIKKLEDANIFTEHVGQGREENERHRRTLPREAVAIG